MKEIIKKFFKPSAFKIILLVIYVFWQYFYSYQGFNLFFSPLVLEYIQNGLGIVSWSNFFIKNLSLVGVWFLLALIIYLVILVFEFISNALHNFRVRRTYANQQPEDIAHLIRQREVFLKTHLLTYLLWTGAIILVVAGFIFVSGIFENLRFTFSDNLFWQLVEGGVDVTYEGLPLLVSSFLVILPLWYLYVSLISLILSEGKYEEERDKITADHYAVVVDEDPIKSEEN